ncbi:hypothetical protein KY092_07950 [Natronomonas gomsonensis]|uniref:hypothetical protein n=1 Tax=Natronomonas gomsonensis TaxID=1046043 RepID=UPI0020CA389C|nr:hypothetical protein [Natronomonas gomsonensis]MCY4730489.1 hypothetical protein [Natronomonas gomsonensis]
MTLSEEQFNSIVKDVMTDLPFVEWDRGTEWTYGDGLKAIGIYGWIDREEDGYKDFVKIEIYEREDAEKAKIEFHGTSSEKYSEEIHRRLFPEDDLETHNECFRLENRFDVENTINLRGENHS